jgi:hypothetical protein
MTGWNISISIDDAHVTAEEIWPDGDGPEDPTAEDVAAVMRAEGSKYRVLFDWNLLDYEELEVSVDGVEVWP